MPHTLYFVIPVSGCSKLSDFECLELNYPSSFFLDSAIYFTFCIIEMFQTFPEICCFVFFFFFCHVVILPCFSKVPGATCLIRPSSDAKCLDTHRDLRGASGEDL